jgi:hypothetical protein
MLAPRVPIDYKAGQASPQRVGASTSNNTTPQPPASRRTRCVGPLLSFALHPGTKVDVSPSHCNCIERTLHPKELRSPIHVPTINHQYESKTSPTLLTAWPDSLPRQLAIPRSTADTARLLALCHNSARTWTSHNSQTQNRRERHLGAKQLQLHSSSTIPTAHILRRSRPRRVTSSEVPRS